MSGECEKCGEHKMSCSCNIATTPLAKALSNVILDYESWKSRNNISNDEMTVADVKFFCIRWVEQHFPSTVKDGMD